MFSVRSNPQLNKESFVFGTHSEYPYFTRTVFNNGILGYVDYLDEEHKIAGNSLAVGMLGMQFFYMGHDFYAGQFTKTVFPKFDGFNEKIGLYFAAVFNKVREHFLKGLVRDFERLFKTFEIPLPVVNKGSRKIDFAYMEAYVRELETARVRELGKWLIASGFDNYRLTAAEQNAIDDYRDGKVRLVEKKVTEIFDVANTHCVLGEWVAGREGHVPYVTASSTNNSVSGYVDYKAEFLDRGNAIVIGGKTFVVTYQKDDFFSNDSHNLVLRLKDRSRQIRDVYLYLVATINAGMGELYSWGDSISFKKIQKDKIVVPVTPAGELDFDFMEKLTRAVMKLAIRGVIEWKDREIAAAKKAARSS